MIFKQIGLKTDQTGNITVDIINMRTGDVAKTLTVPSVANVLSFSLEPEFSLPLTDKYGPIYYRVEYSLDGNYFDIKYSCSCGLDYYKSIVRWAELEGFVYTSDYDTDKISTQFTGGLLIDAVIGCDPETSICRAMDDDAAANSVIARTLQLMAIMNIGANILKSTNINRFTTLSAEGVAAHMQALDIQIQYRLDWLIQKSQAITGNCYACKPAFFINRESIII